MRFVYTGPKQSSSSYPIICNLRNQCMNSQSSLRALERVEPVIEANCVTRIQRTLVRLVVMFLLALPILWVGFWLALFWPSIGNSWSTLVPTIIKDQLLFRADFYGGRTTRPKWTDFAPSIWVPVSCERSLVIRDMSLIPNPDTKSISPEIQEVSMQIRQTRGMSIVRMPMA